MKSLTKGLILFITAGLLVMLPFMARAQVSDDAITGPRSDEAESLFIDAYTKIAALGTAADINPAMITDAVEAVQKLEPYNDMMHANAEYGVYDEISNLFSSAMQEQMLKSATVNNVGLGVVRDVSGVTMVWDDGSLFVGTPAEDGSGSITEYKSVSGQLQLAGKIMVPGLQANARFGAAFVEKNGILAAATLASDGHQGPLYIFRRNSAGVFDQVQSVLLDVQAVSMDQDGAAITGGLTTDPVTAIRLAMDTGTIAVGLPERDEVRVLKATGPINTSAWTTDRIIKDIKSKDIVRFGESVAVSGNRLAVGAPANGSDPSVSGGVFVYQMASTVSGGAYSFEWAPSGEVPSFGSSVGLAPNFVVSAATTVGGNFIGTTLVVGTDPGVAYMYQERITRVTLSRTSSAWPMADRSILTLLPLPQDVSGLKLKVSAGNGRIVLNSMNGKDGNVSVWNIYKQGLDGKWKLEQVGPPAGIDGAIMIDGPVVGYGEPANASASADTKNSYSFVVPGIVQSGTCGNGTKDPGEDCDPAMVNAKTCADLNLPGLTLPVTCTNSCKWDTSRCVPVCGDGMVEGTEQCDGTNLNNQTCQSKGFASGTLLCSSGCTFDTSNCVPIDVNTDPANCGSIGHVCQTGAAMCVNGQCVAPVNCVGAWGGCSATCGGGSQTYTITTPAANGGISCPVVNGATQSCNTQACPVNCAGAWGTCSKTCGGGSQTYTVTTPAANGGISCPVANGATQSCNTQACPVNCAGAWGSCSATCGGGSQTYTVTTPAANGGASCLIANGTIQTCNAQVCSVDGTCGAAANKVYAYNEPFLTASACLTGRSSGVVDPLPGTTSTWQCLGVSNIGKTATCTATRAAAPVNGVCGTTNNACKAGTLKDLSDTSSENLWSCLGANGGTTAQCKLCIAPYQLMDTVCRLIVSPPSNLILRVSQAYTIMIVRPGMSSPSPSLLLDWSPSVDLAGKPVSYEVYSSTDGRTFTLTGRTSLTEWNFPVMPTRGIFYYKVQAVDAAGNRSPDSNVVTARFPMAVAL